METCPLCHSGSLKPFLQLDGEAYLHCESCALVLKASAHWPSRATEKSHYDMHRNDPADVGYRHFLSRATNPLLSRLGEAAEGLDYGCGPGPALVAMMREAGMACHGYDPIYADHKELLHRSYDFITCTEVVEHFHRPGEEFLTLTQMLKPGGWLAVMTSWYPQAKQFADWHYRRDPTHVCFYAPATFRWLARYHGLTLTIAADQVVLLHKPADSGK